MTSSIPVSQNLTEDIETIVVGSLINTPELIEDFMSEIGVNALVGQAYWVGLAIRDLADEGETVNFESVSHKMQLQNTLARAGGHLWLHECTERAYYTAADPRWYFDLLAQRLARREAIELSIKAKQMAGEDMDVASWAEYVAAEASRIAALTGGSTTEPLYPVNEVLQFEDVPTDWTVPGLITRGSATMVTAEEGAGKSVWLRQIAMSASMGINPFDPGPTTNYEPQRVLLVNCEGSTNQLNRSLRNLWNYGGQFTQTNRPQLYVESHPGGLDLSRAKDQGWLLRRCEQAKAQLLVIGPVYRFTEGDLNIEEEVRKWQRCFEKVMAEGCSIITEHHATNEQAGSPRLLRPIGSSAMRRWFGQGIALRRRKCDQHEDKFCQQCIREGTVEMWRGARDDEVRWPRWVRGVQGHTWWLADQRADMSA